MQWYDNLQNGKKKKSNCRIFCKALYEEAEFINIKTQTMKLIRISNIFLFRKLVSEDCYFKTHLKETFIIKQ